MPDGRMTEAELAEVEARASKATPGPWRPEPMYDGSRTVAIMRSTTVACVNAGAGSRPYDQLNENSAFIAASRADVPRLVAALRAAWEKLEKVTTWLERCAQSQDEQADHYGDSFRSLAESRRKDAANFRTTAKDIRSILGGSS